MPQWRKNDYFDANLRRYITMMTPRRLRDVIRHLDSPPPGYGQARCSSSTLNTSAALIMFPWSQRCLLLFMIIILTAGYKYGHTISSVTKHGTIPGQPAPASPVHCSMVILLLLLSASYCGGDIIQEGEDYTKVTTYPKKPFSRRIITFQPGRNLST